MSICTGSPCAYGGVEAMRAYQQQLLRADQEKLVLEQRREVQHQLENRSAQKAILPGTPSDNDLPAVLQVNQVSPVDVSLGLANPTIGGTVNTYA